MTTNLKDLLERVESWPEAAQNELVAVANQIESELQGGDYVATREELEIMTLPMNRRSYLATREELQIIDAAMASIDAGEVATDAEIKAAFAKFARLTLKL